MEVSENRCSALWWLLPLGVVMFDFGLDVVFSLQILLFMAVTVGCILSLWQPSVHPKHKFIGVLLFQILFSVEILATLTMERGTALTGVSLLVLGLMALIHFGTKRVVMDTCVSPVWEEGVLSFEDLRYLRRRIDYQRDVMSRVGGVLTPVSVKDMMCEIPRNCSIRYVNKDALSETYLENLEESLSDPYVYLVLSDTGSVASNFIGILTNKPYNHCSISFDPGLKTLISYNGGEKLAPPGLNPELLEWFYKKEDASIRVYRLEVTLEQKRGMADKIREIDREGSAYNLVGVAVGKSLQPNIMVCSEFVYNLLKSVGAEYFEKPPLETKPTDMVELDYERKLHYVETIQLSMCCEEMMEKGKPVPMESKVELQMIEILTAHLKGELQETGERAGK